MRCILFNHYILSGGYIVSILRKVFSVRCGAIPNKHAKSGCYVDSCLLARVLHFKTTSTFHKHLAGAPAERSNLIEKVHFKFGHNIFILIVFLILMDPKAYIGLWFHEWAGLIIGLFFILHKLLNWNWIK